MGRTGMHADAAERLRVGIAVVQGVNKLVEEADVQRAMRHVEVNVSESRSSVGERRSRDADTVSAHLHIGTIMTQASVCSMSEVSLTSASSAM